MIIVPTNFKSQVPEFFKYCSRAAVWLRKQFLTKPKMLSFERANWKIHVFLQKFLYFAWFYTLVDQVDRVDRFLLQILHFLCAKLFT